MILERILEAKREEVARARKAVSLQALREAPLYAEARRGFHAALRQGSGRRIIAEIKKASPSRGVIREDFDPARHAREYQNAGAVCISVLTDERFFAGSLDFLISVHGACEIPLLRKDFVFDDYQIIEARAAGADAVLLIVAAMDSGRLEDLLAVAQQERLDVVTEVHDEFELDTALTAGAGIVGINNRDLKTFETSSDVTRRLATRAPDSVTLVSESGLGSAAELAELEALGVDAFLIGEALMAAPDPGLALESFLEA